MAIHSFEKKIIRSHKYKSSKICNIYSNLCKQSDNGVEVAVPKWWKHFFHPSYNTPLAQRCDFRYLKLDILSKHPTVKVPKCTNEKHAIHLQFFKSELMGFLVLSMGRFNFFCILKVIVTVNELRNHNYCVIVYCKYSY